MNLNERLPKLPRVLKQKEASFGVQFRHWILQKRLPTGAYELKQTTATAIPFSALGDDQIAYLLRIKGSKGEIVRVQGVKGEPDYIYMRRSSAWVVIKFPRSFHVIDIDTFLEEKKNSKRRSLTAARATELSTWSQ